MRLEISRRSDLALLALLELMATEGKLPARRLAERVGTSTGFLSQVLSPLVDQGWVRSEPGPGGGYTSVVEPRSLSVLEVVEATEGPTDTGRCVLEDHPCREARPCALHRAWTAARHRLTEELGATTLASLLPPDGA